MRTVPHDRSIGSDAFSAVFAHLMSPVITDIGPQRVRHVVPRRDVGTHRRHQDGGRQRAEAGQLPVVNVKVRENEVPLLVPVTVTWYAVLAASGVSAAT